ncbi:hypothetical protein CHARACLAT_018566 [Characodon lateralis]|uniref:Uncharacterized protein n=1 Tax=Characodon lateralis TaxID=208331 RepID=A0ABU7F440_9TELE|nr:hypothetical protein [Characodon lateralis]
MACRHHTVSPRLASPVASATGDGAPIEPCSNVVPHHPHSASLPVAHSCLATGSQQDASYTQLGKNSVKIMFFFVFSANCLFISLPPLKSLKCVTEFVEFLVAF